ncbi:MAG: PTS system mannose/fructose/sorbose family transporter subunit IID, partial [Anaerolineae bacterium]|nr:PTS system mannose/fructose/sorbose family transporter subunit IID [Anaerolineae bacterium]
MSVLQAALIALMYAFARSAFNAGLGGYVLSQPLVAGTLAGALLGDPLRGAQIGGAFNLGTLALSQLRVRLGPDIALVGYVGVPLMLLSGLRPDEEATAALFGALLVFGTVLSFARGLFNTLIAHWVDYFADQGQIEAVAIVSVVPTQIWTVLTAFIPAFGMLLFDAPTLGGIATSIPAWLQAALRLTQTLLAALGIAASLRLVAQGSGFAYFLLGWALAPFTGLVQATLLGVSAATIHAYLTRRTLSAGRDTLVTDVLPSEQSEVYTARRQLAWAEAQMAFLLWMFFHDAGANFERRQNLGFAAALAPVGRALCETLEERIALLRRTLTLFATEWTFGAALVGAVVALEERRANGEAINDAELVGAKLSGMAALNALGTAIMTNGLASLLVAVGVDLANAGSLLGVALFVVVQSLAVIGVGFASFNLGFGYVRRFAERARLNNWLRPALFGATRLGAFTLGLLVPVFVPLSLPEGAALTIGSVVWSPQTRVLDATLPNGIPLLLTLSLWVLLRRRWQPLTLFGVCLIAAVFGGAVAELLGW